MQVCMKASGSLPYAPAEGEGGVRIVCVLNYNRLGFIAEVRSVCVYVWVS